MPTHVEQIVQRGLSYLMISRRTIRGLWLFILISFVGGLFAQKPEMLIGLASIFSSTSIWVDISVALLFCFVLGGTLAFVVLSNKKRFLAKRSYVVAGVLQFILTYGAVYAATLVGLWIAGKITIEGPRLPMTALDCAILLYSCFLYPVLKIAYDYLGIVVDDGVDFSRFHIASNGFLTRYDSYVARPSETALEIKCRITGEQIANMASEFNKATNHRVITEGDRAESRVERCLTELSTFFMDYSKNPTSKSPEMEEFFSGGVVHTNKTIDKALKAVVEIREVGQI